MTKETVMSAFGVKYDGSDFDFGACSDMPGFTVAFTAACEAEAAIVRAKVAAQMESEGFDTQAIIEDEGMGEDSVGPVESLIVSDDGDLTDGDHSEAADLSSPDAFRAQVRRWKDAISA